MSSLMSDAIVVIIFGSLGFGVGAGDSHLVRGQGEGARLHIVIPKV